MDNNLYKKAYAFTILITKAYQYLSFANHELVLSKRLLKSATSIGANITEANGAISQTDFSAKLSISYKECLEIKYWLSLLKDTNFITVDTFENMHSDADEPAKILFTILKKTRIDN